MSNGGLPLPCQPVNRRPARPAKFMDTLLFLALIQGLGVSPIPSGQEVASSFPALEFIHS
jgi:hypothetical protein